MSLSYIITGVILIAVGLIIQKFLNTVWSNVVAWILIIVGAILLIVGIIFLVLPAFPDLLLPLLHN